MELVSSIDQYIVLLVGLGFATGFIAIVAVILLFGFSIQQTAKHAMQLFVIGAVTGAGAFGIGRALQNTPSSTPYTQAAPEAVIMKWQTDSSDGRVRRVYFQTGTPSRVYLEYFDPSGDMTPIFSSESVIKMTEHEFTSLSLDPQGKLFVVIDGVRISHEF